MNFKLPPITPLSEHQQLFEQSHTSIEAQDDYHAYLLDAGLLSANGIRMSDDEARAEMQRIVDLPASNSEKDALLSALDVKIQNQGEGIASPVIREILAQQWQYIKGGLK